MLCKRKISIREANLGDSRLLYNWANDPVVRQMAFHSEPIPWETHCKWLEAKLQSNKSHLTICYTGNTPVGQVRFDEVSPGEFEIDISVDRNLRGNGRGSEMLAAAINYVHSNYQISSFWAEVKTENIPSQRMFLATGFKLIKVDDQVNYYKLQLEK